MRSAGLELFTAVHGGLILAWATKTHWAIPLLGLSSCAAFFLWDVRNRFMLRMVTGLGEMLVDKAVFGSDANGRATDGMYKMINDSLKKSEHTWDAFEATVKYGSHTQAIRLMIVVAASIWILIAASLIVGGI